MNGRRRLWWIVALAVAGLCACSTGVGPAPELTNPTTASRTHAPADARIPLSSLRGRILFTRAGGQFGDETVFVADADGHGERRITDPDLHCCPRWTPDGHHVLVSALAPDGRITTGLLEASGGRVRPLALPAGDLNLGCSSGGQSAATRRLLCEGFSDTKPGLAGVYTADAAGAHLIRLTPCCSPQDDRAVGFSPDGRRAYVFRPIAGYPSYGDTLEGALFAVNVDGTGLRQLTPRWLPVEAVGGGGARVSPDGRLLVFSSGGVIWTVTVDGDHVAKVFQDAGGRLAITPTWSPDGTFLMFGLDQPGQLAFERNPPSNGLYVVRSDGTGVTPVITTHDYKSQPDWTAP